MLTEYLIKKVLDSVADIAKKILKESDPKIGISREDIEESINFHLQLIRNWSGEVSFNDLKRAKRTADIFIEPDLFEYPRRLRTHPIEVVQQVPLRNIFEYSQANHFVLLGSPGSGKTTSMKYLCQCLLYQEDFLNDRFSFPILIQCRDFNSIEDESETLIIDQLYKILGLKVELPPDWDKNHDAYGLNTIKEKLVISVLEELKVLLILDGVDELATIKKREEVIRQISQLASHLENSSMIVTSRTGDFIYNIENTIQYELCPLSHEQISAFSIKWLNNKQEASDFVSAIYNSPIADTAIRPLTLAHLCAIYERIGRIPDKPKTIYRKIINLLLEEWDQQRSIKRYSHYAQFEVDRKFEFLCYLAYMLTTSLEKSIFSKRDLLNVYAQIYHDYNLVKSEAQQVVNELEAHTGIFIQSGYEEFEFAHKSLQEYLTAEYIVRLPTIPGSKHGISKLANELAIAIAISSRPGDYFSELVFNKFMKQEVHYNSLRDFLNRLVVEKPDFNTTTNVSLPLIALYSQYIKPQIINYQKGLSFDDPLLSDFEEVMVLGPHKNTMDIAPELYIVDYTYKMIDGNNVYRMIKKKEAEGLTYLPNVLYIRNSLLEPGTR